MALDRFDVECAADGTARVIFAGFARSGYTKISWLEGTASLRLEGAGDDRRAVALSFDLDWL